MERLHKSGPDERHPAGPDHSAAWLMLILLVIVALVV